MQAGPGVQAVRPFKLRKSLGMGQCGAAERGGRRCARNACALFRAATRREEVASTRSLLNTARLMEENRTLMRLKEMEYIERICENVGNISLNGNGDLLAQLQQLLERHAS